MPLFPGYDQIRSTSEREWRTNNKLFLSDLEPAGSKWLVDPRLPNQFMYHFGATDPDEWVVIPKGRVVSMVPGNYRLRDFPSGKYYPALTIANGGQDVTEIDQAKVDAGASGAPTYTRVANRPVGIADRNIFKRIPDTFNGNEPYFRRYGYLELPWIPDSSKAASMKWGCVTGSTSAIDVTDYLKADEHGHLVKWDPENDDPLQKVGQVMFIDTNVPPEGWLQWVMGGDLDEATRQRFPYLQNKRDARFSGYRPNDLLDNMGYPYDRRYREQDVIGPDGIKGLTDGSYLETEYVDEKIGVVPDDAEIDDTLYFHVEHTPIVEGSLSVTIGGVSATPEYVDLKSGLVVIKVPGDGGATPSAVTGDVLASYKATGQTGGWPTHWDFSGSIGAVHIALCIGG